MPYANPEERRAYHRRYMRNYSKKKRNYQRTMSLIYRLRNRLFVFRVKRRFGCKHCGMNNPVCLDFHHLGNKKISVGEMIGQTHSIESIKIEMRKCIILCANCHRIEEARKKGTLMDGKNKPAKEVQAGLRRAVKANGQGNDLPRPTPSKPRTSPVGNRGTAPQYTRNRNEK